MSFRPSQIVAIIALLVCFICPILELFDSWDHTAQTGNDTEYAVVVVGLCVGVAYSLGRLLLRTQVLRRSLRPLGHSDNGALASEIVLLFCLPEVASSPPSLSLRI